jgi:5'-AMP-activated protein kinase regulatory beta subunit
MECAFLRGAMDISAPLERRIASEANVAPKQLRRVRFTVDAPPGSQVSVVGSFNGWTAGRHPLHPTVDEPGLFDRTLLLPEGRYEYKFVIEGEWTADPGCPRWVVNEFKTLNSVLEIS